MKATQTQLDQIVDAFCNDNAYVYNDGNITVNIDNPDGFYVEGYAMVYGHKYDNRVVIDGHSYKEGTYYEVDGVRHIDIEAWQGDDKLDLDLNYIKKGIINNINY